MDSDSWLGIGGLAFCLALFSLMPASEAGLASLGRGRVRDLLTKGVPSARTLDELLQQSHSLSPAIIAKGVTFAVFSYLLTLSAVRLLMPSWLQIMGIIAAGLAIVVFTQLASRGLAARNKELPIL